MPNQEHDRAADLYGTIGVRPIIHMVGTTTRYGGTILRPEAQQAMEDAAGALVDMHQLNVRAGEAIATMIGAEAAVVTSGAAGALLLQAAAVIAGSDPAKIARLPDTEGMTNEIVMQRVHRMGYDQCFRAAGGKIVEVGFGNNTEEWQMEDAIGEKTAAVAHIVSPGNGGRGLGFEKAMDIAHRNGVPLIVDAASMLPPRDNLFKFANAGADLVCYSGGKGIRGPQGTGILVGKADLVEAARLNAAPNAAIGRSAKVSKEEIMGLIAALDAFLKGDEEQEMATYRRRCEDLIDHLDEVPGVTATVEQDGFVYLIPEAVVRFDSSWTGRSAAEIVQALAEGDPPIYAKALQPQEGLVFNPFNPTDEEVQIVGRRLREELLAD
jgi:D-glucosaminate-6-phosphate ammonia-lyase